VFSGGLMHFPLISAPTIGLTDSVIGDGAGAGASAKIGSVVGSTLEESEGLFIKKKVAIPRITIATTSPAINFIDHDLTHRLTR
jgi:hypothetical protein